MFSVSEKQAISDAIQKILRDTNHPELPEGEIEFEIYVFEKQGWRTAVIQNNSAVTNPSVNRWNEEQAANK